MENSINTSPSQITMPKAMPFVFIAITILFTCLSLFYLDHETTSILLLFKPSNLFALLLYFLPTFCICSFLYMRNQKKYNEKKSIALALLIGIPISLIFVMSILYFLLHK
jgi:RsiW-degrading membrane proteinase PrsW (M82 family)